MARPIADDHDEKRAQILKTAAHLFATEGFVSTSVSQLAKECGISKANIYHYYRAKDAILYGILGTYLKDLRDAVCDVALDGLSPEEKLRTVIRTILVAYQGADDEHRVQIASMSYLPDDQQAELREYQREMVSFLGGIVKEVAPEIFAEDTTALRSTTMSIFGMLNWYYMWNTGAGSAAREAYAQHVADIVLEGIVGMRTRSGLEAANQA